MINYYNHFLIIKKIVLNFFGFLEKFYFLNNIRHKLMKDITLLNFFINSTLLLENHLKFNKFYAKLFVLCINYFTPYIKITNNIYECNLFLKNYY